MISGFNVTTVIQGEVSISDDPNVVLTTLLGSCVAVCLYDPLARVGGMNHFLLPGSGYKREQNNSSLLFGANAMENLITGILRKGGDRRRLLCKAFGGAAVLSKMGDVGQDNVLFLRDYLRKRDIHCVSYSLGGKDVRRIRFWPTTGKVMQAMCKVQQAPEGLEL